LARTIRSTVGSFGVAYRSTFKCITKEPMDESPTENFEHIEHARHAAHDGDPFLSTVAMTVNSLAITGLTQSR
jgi:hypothetical protein